MLPRGIRNHNPGNIIQNKTQWKGARKQPFDPKFVEFETPEWGIRAMMRILQTYYHKYGLDNVQAIINRWAPPHENATDQYAHYVAKFMGVKRFDAMDVNDPKVLIPLCQAIVIFENGRPKKELQETYPEAWYEEAQYQAAYNLLQTQYA